LIFLARLKLDFEIPRFLLNVYCFQIFKEVQHLDHFILKLINQQIVLHYPSSFFNTNKMASLSSCRKNVIHWKIPQPSQDFVFLGEINPIGSQIISLTQLNYLLLKTISFVLKYLVIQVNLKYRLSAIKLLETEQIISAIPFRFYFLAIHQLKNCGIKSVDCYLEDRYFLMERKFKSIRVTWFS